MLCRLRWWLWWSNSRFSFWNNLQSIPPSSMNPNIDDLGNRCNNMEKMIRSTLDLIDAMSIMYWVVVLSYKKNFLQFFISFSIITWLFPWPIFWKKARARNTIGSLNCSSSRNYWWWRLCYYCDDYYNLELQLLKPDGGYGITHLFTSESMCLKRKIGFVCWPSRTSKEKNIFRKTIITDQVQPWWDKTWRTEKRGKFIIIDHQ